MRFLRRAMSGLFLLALTLGLLALGGRAVWLAVAEAMAPADVGIAAQERRFSANVIPVVAQTLAPELIAYGDVRSMRTLELRAPESGRIAELAPGFADGAEVAAGQVLVRLDPADRQAARDVAASDLATAQAELRAFTQAIPLTQDELAGAAITASLRQHALERQRNLVARGAGTEALVQEAELAQNSAAQSVLSARAAVAQATSRRDLAAAALDRARIAAAEADRALADTTLRAAFSGVLAGVAVVEGGQVSANEKLAQIIDPAALEVSFRLSTAQYARLLDANGALAPLSLTVALEVEGNQVATTGSLSRVGAEVGEGQTGRLVYARLAAARGFRPGDFVTVRLVEPALTEVALLPAAAVGADGMVLVLGPDDRLEAVAAVVLRRQGDAVIVAAAGLTGRDVVAERTPLLGRGVRVTPIRAGAGAEKAGVVAATDAATAEDLVALTPERRAELVAMVEANSRIPAEARAALLAELQQDRVPAATIARLTAHRGG